MQHDFIAVFTMGTYAIVLESIGLEMVFFLCDFYITEVFFLLRVQAV
jgi:hypothetical protein